ncbi:uncharacterized protein LOC116015871 [Ipomoea triloba]|uniref:uncharacterized protein LOC116015871 n=1 Tax=Ipomoea triloba TaxID=35885 RepID=UPI00125E58A8|nr:uncharacterized protein LOC116015871 [Ipomoea triloba]
MSYFASNVQKRKEFADLYHVKQRPADSLPEFLNKWKREVLGVANFDDRAAIIIFRNNLRSGPFYRDLIRYPPKTYNELMDRATRFAEAEVAEKRKKEEEEGRSRKDKAPQEERWAPRPPCREFVEGLRLTPTRFLTPLTQPVSTILNHAEGQGIVQYLGECMKISPKVDPNKYCRFHHQTGHDTDECIHLKRQIEDLIQRGYLGQFVKRPGGQGQAHHKRELGHLTEDEEKELDNPAPQKKQAIHVIFGGPEGGDTPTERKRWARSLYVGEVVRPPHENRPRREPIVFTDADLPDSPLPHRDALVIKVEISDVIVHRVLVDTGSSVNVMYYDTFTQLGLSRKQLGQVRTPLAGFTGDSIETEGP